MNIRDASSDRDSDDRDSNGREPGNEPPTADVLAGEYVLGVLDAAQRRDAQARIERDAAFARLVHGWERRLAAMLDDIAPVAPPHFVWPRIRTRLGWSPLDHDTSARRPWQRIGFWQAAAGLATAAALTVVFIGPRVAPTPPDTAAITSPQPRAVTTLLRDDGTPGWLASIDPERGTVLLMPAPAPADIEGRVTELWLIPAGEAPRSLGLLATGETREIVIPDDLRRALVEGSTLAVSLEPAGGSPTGAPTGPIVAKGGVELI
jgi:anti-sigma-K factor RskA